MGSGQVHHVLIEFARKKYHIGSSKTSQASFRTLWKCLRSVRKYAYRGLVFTRNVDFHVAVNKQELTLETDDEAEARAEAALETTAPTASVWRTRTRSSSMSSGGTNSRHASPRKPKRVSGLQANQEHVQMPQMARVHELSVGFYDQLLQRLTELSAQQPQSPGAICSGASALEWMFHAEICCNITGGKQDTTAISDELASLLFMVRVSIGSCAELVMKSHSFSAAALGQDGAKRVEDAASNGRRGGAMAAAGQGHGGVEPHRHEPRACACCKSAVALGSEPVLFVQHRN